jgi:hypothetical protein
MPATQRSSSGSASRPENGKERHQKGDVIIEYQKPQRKKPKVDADDVDFEVIE